MTARRSILAAACASLLVAALDGCTSTDGESGPVEESSDAGGSSDGAGDETHEDSSNRADSSNVRPPCSTSSCVAAISAGNFHTCALLTDGTVRCWGNNFFGQLGDGTTDASTTPVLVKDLSNVVQISAGGEHTCALLKDGTARCWGYNHYGQVGNASGFQDLPVEDISDAVQISAGRVHTCAVLKDGTARCWGDNNEGALGDGYILSPVYPPPVKGLTTIAEISAGGRPSGSGAETTATCARRTNGTAYCWGRVFVGEPDYANNRSAPPTLVPGLSGVEQISVGGTHACAVLTDGTARCWGSSNTGALGNGAKVSSSKDPPVTVTSLSGVAEVRAGIYHTCARSTDGTAHCWGANDFGQIGDGTTSDEPRLTPSVVAGLSGVEEIAVGGSWTCARLNDGTVRCWGGHINGPMPTPTPIVW